VAWMSVSSECFVLSGRGLCVGLIIRPEASYRVWCVSECHGEASMRWILFHTVIRSACLMLPFLGTKKKLAPKLLQMFQKFKLHEWNFGETPIMTWRAPKHTRKAFEHQWSTRDNNVWMSESHSLQSPGIGLPSSVNECAVSSFRSGAALETSASGTISFPLHETHSGLHRSAWYQLLKIGFHRQQEEFETFALIFQSMWFSRSLGVPLWRRAIFELTELLLCRNFWYRK
jgi:hypothetical protein